MEYISTRGHGPVSFKEALLGGIAPDGGLYVPVKYPTFSNQFFEELSYISYEEMVEKIMAPFMGDTFDPKVFSRMVKRAYENFDDIEITPLVQYDLESWILELFHGPTHSFKDIALQLMGRMLSRILEEEDKEITVIGATSGDTGPAAMEGLKNKENINVFMLFPHNRVSHIQRLQMTTMGAPNIFPIAIEGTFDDCQAIAKELLGDADLKKKLSTTAVNSISWARLLPQMVYYFYAWTRLKDIVENEAITFAVPSGNFGNVFAGYVAMQCGLPVKKFLVCSNENDILYRFFKDGDYSTKPVIATKAPSIDILVASNLERFLFDLTGRDSKRTAQMMETFKKEGKLPSISEIELDDAQSIFSAEKADEKEMLKALSKMDALKKITVDPHTAVALAALEKADISGPKVVLSTAHPAKFPQAVQSATGNLPDEPGSIAKLKMKQEAFEILPNDVQEVRKYILESK